MPSNNRSLTAVVSVSSFGEADASPMDMLRSSGVQVVENSYKRRLTETELTRLVGQADGLIAGTEPITETVLDAAPSLRVISRVGVGLDSVDLAAAAARGIEVRTTPDAVTDPVAELTLAGILSSLRHIHTVHADLRDGRWQRRMGRLLRNQVVGIIGYGRIGRRLRELLRPFHVDVVACDPSLTHATASEQGVTLVSLGDLLKKSDVVTLHLPGGDEPLIGYSELETMSSNSVLINTSRGGIVDEAALVAALRDNKIGGAYIDTYEEEPYQGPLSELDTVLLTPHIGSYAAEARSQMEAEAVANLLETLKVERR